MKKARNSKVLHKTESKPLVRKDKKVSKFKHAQKINLFVNELPKR